ncbi:MAG: oxidoreductase [bacterium]
MAKLKIAVYWAASCGGCEISVLEIHHHLLAVADVADLVFCPCLVDTKYSDVEAMEDGAIDLCLFNGAIRTEENVELARLLRRKSKTLVAFGACASTGGIPGMANAFTLTELLEAAYLSSPSTPNPEGVLPQPRTRLREGIELTLPPLLPAVRALHHVVAVDYVVPGCPPEGKQVWAVLQAVVSGELPPTGAVLGAGNRTVCEECPLEKRDRRIRTFKRPHELIPDGVSCLLEQGVVCMGPATRSGCEARCPTVDMPCRGCYGAAGSAVDAGLKMIGALGALLDADDEDSIRALVDEVVDPVGTFYRFGLPASHLGLAKSALPTEEGEA